MGRITRTEGKSSAHFGLQGLPPKTLTVNDFIQRKIGEDGRAPTYSAVCVGTGLSAAEVRIAVAALEAHGLVKPWEQWRVRNDCGKIVVRWSPDELDLLRRAVADGLSWGEAHRLFPHRTRDSVKDRYYALRGPSGRDYTERDLPPALSDARRQKDAREGSARLYDALVKAGLYVPPELKKSA